MKCFDGQRERDGARRELTTVSLDVSHSIRGDEFVIVGAARAAAEETNNPPRNIS